MKTKTFLVMIALSMMVSVPAFAGKECFEGLAPATAKGLYTAATNLDVAVAALATKPLETVGGGIEGICVASNAVAKTTGMLAEGCAGGLYIAATNLDVAVVALATKPLETMGGGIEGVCKGTDAILKCVFGASK